MHSAVVTPCHSAPVGGMFGYKKRCNRREQKMSDPGQVHSAAARVGVLRAARDWLERDGRVALATVIDTWV